MVKTAALYIRRDFLTFVPVRIIVPWTDQKGTGVNGFKDATYSQE